MKKLTALALSLLICLMSLASCKDDEEITTLSDSYSCVTKESSLPESDLPAEPSSESSEPTEPSHPQEDTGKEVPGPKEIIFLSEDKSISIPILAEFPKAETRSPLSITEGPGYGLHWPEEEFFPAEVVFGEDFIIPETVPVYRYVPNEHTLNVVETFKKLYPDFTLTLSGYEEKNILFYGSCAEHSFWYNVASPDGRSARCDFNTANGFARCYRYPVDFAMSKTDDYIFDPEALAFKACLTAAAFHGITGDIVLTGYEEDIWQQDWSYDEDGNVTCTQYAVAKFTFVSAKPPAAGGLSFPDYMEISVLPDGTVFTIENYISAAEYNLISEVEVAGILSEDSLREYFKALGTGKEGDVITLVSAKLMSRPEVDVDIFRPVIEIGYTLTSEGVTTAHSLTVAAAEENTFSLFGGNLGEMY